MIEEPEMGLHPQAIVSLGLLMLELLQRGSISTKFPKRSAPVSFKITVSARRVSR